VAVLAAAAGLGLSAPAQAATCSTASGVSVVVDFHQLGGVQTACDAGGAGKYAAAQFTDVGHTLTYVQGQAFVCQVDGAPDTQCARTPPSTAYWSLWWSDGKSGTWTYASVGATSLKVPAGGYVALSWQQGSAQAPPGVAPRSHSPSSPTSHPPSHPTSRPTSQPTAGPTAPATAAPQQGATSGPTPRSTSTSPAGTSAPTGTPASTFPVRSHHTQALKVTAQGKHAIPPTSTQATRAASATTDSGSGLPGWVAPVLVVVLFAAAAAVAVVRRRRSGGS
jgi:hypothetical protein